MQMVLPDSNYDALSSVTVESIPSAYIIPTGTISITANGTVDVTNYTSASVNVAGGGVDMPTFTITYDEDWNANTVTTEWTFAEVLAYDNDGEGGYEASVTSIGPDESQWQSVAVMQTESYWDDEEETDVITGFRFRTVLADATPDVEFRYLADGTLTDPSLADFWEDLTITQNGVYFPSENKAINMVTVNVPSGGDLQSKTATPTESTQYIVPDQGYYGLSSVEVGAISSTYVGSGITRRSSNDITFNTGTRIITVPAGYYETQGTQQLEAGSATASATKGTVSNHQVTITPKAIRTSEYITNGTSNGTAVTVSASELVSGNLPITANGTNIDVTNYASVNVTVPSSTPSLQSKTVTPTESQQSIQPDSGYDGLSAVTINAIPSTYVGSSVTTKTAATITPGITNQTIASGTYLTGTQTIVGDADLTAANIKTGVQIFGVTGSYTSDATASAADIINGKTGYVNGSKITGSLIVQKYYTGTSTPSSSLGSNGDIYVQQ